MSFSPLSFELLITNAPKFWEAHPRSLACRPTLTIVARGCTGSDGCEQKPPITMMMDGTITLSLSLSCLDYIDDDISPPTAPSFYKQNQAWTACNRGIAKIAAPDPQKNSHSISRFKIRRASSRPHLSVCVSPTSAGPLLPPGVQGSSTLHT